MRAGWWLAVFLILSARAGAVYYGEPRAEVLAELGRPASSIVRGNRKVLIYPKGVRLELEAGKVAVVIGLEVGEGPVQTAEETSPEIKPVEEAKPAEVEPEEPDVPPLTPEQLEALEEAEAKAEKEWAEQSAKARAEMEKSITDMEKIHDRSSEPPPPKPGFNAPGFIIKLVLKWLLMLAALKLTCKYWSVDVDWRGLMLAAAADTGAGAVVSLFGLVVLQMFTVFYADEAVGAVVLVMVLRKVSTNQSLQQAVTITMTSKVFSIVVGSFLLTVLLRALF